MKTALTTVLAALLLFAFTAMAAEIIRVGRIQSDVTLMNKEVTVSGAVTQVQPDGGNPSWGRFILRDSYDGKTIMVVSDALPAPSSTPREFKVLVQKEGKRVFLKHVTYVPSGGLSDALTDPLYIIGGIFLLVMLALLYYLFKPEKAEEPEPMPAQMSQQAQQPMAAPVQNVVERAAPAPAPDETLDLFGYFTVIESMNAALKGSKIPVTVKETGSTLCRGGDIDIADKSFSSTSGKISPNGGDALLMENVSRKYPLFVTSSSGHKSTLNYGDSIELANGDIIEQENSAVKLEFFGTGDHTVDI